MNTLLLKRLFCLLALAIFAPLASAQVTVKCELVEGSRFYDSDYTTLTIASTQPIVIFEERYRSEDAVFNLPKGGVHTKGPIFSGLSSSGKYVVVASDGSMQVVPFRCDPRRAQKSR